MSSHGCAFEAGKKIIALSSKILAKTFGIYENYIYLCNIKEREFTTNHLKMRIMKSVYAKDIKAITKIFNLSEDEIWFLKNLSDSINSEKSEICMDIQEVLLYGTSIDEKANAVKALLVYFGAKAQKENDLRNKFDQTTWKLEKCSNVALGK